MTVSTTELRQHFEHENQLWKQGDHYRQGRVRDAYNAWFKAEVQAGRPPDALVRRIEDETERFLDRVIAGVDGHSYWTGSERFTRNDGKSCYPRTWWHTHTNGAPEARAIIRPACGEHHCIAPEHQAVTLWSETKRRFTDAQCVGALQVAAMRLKRTPTMKEYRALGLSPSFESIKIRFSSWRRAIDAAGLPQAAPGGPLGERWSATDCVAALRAFRASRGYVPTGNEWKKTHQLPSEHTIRRRLGSWNNALAEAGLK